MSLLNKNYNFTPFSAPDGVAPATTITGKGEGVESLINALADDNDPPNTDLINLDEPNADKAKPDGKVKEPKSEKDEGEEEVSEEDEEEGEEGDEEDDELEDLLSETEEPDADKLELTTPVRKREILAKYPTLFKDFPFLENAYYREQAFTQIVPTIADAKEAVEKSRILDAFEADVSKGDVEKIYVGMKEDNPDSFYRSIDNFLPMLQKVDEKAYHHVIGTITKHTILQMVQEAQEAGSKELQQAAALLNQFVFGSTKFVPITKLVEDKPEPKDNSKSELDKEREQFRQERLTTAQTEVKTKIDNSIKATIEANIDPKGSMSPFVKKMAIREALDSVTSLMKKDGRFNTILKQLWDAAERSRFSPEAVERISKAYKSRARTVLGAAINNARKEALKGQGKRTKEDQESPDKEEKQEKSQKGRSTTPTNRGHNTTGKRPGESDLDFLMRD